MATIEERAKAYRKETERTVFKSDMDISTMEFEYAYKQGATDQAAIEIEHACQAYCKTCMYCKDKCETGWKCEAYADFRKAMEE